MSDAKTPKTPFDFKTAVPLLRKAVRPYPKAAMFDLVERGHGSVFELLVGCILSIRTRDETTLPASLRLFEKARTPAAMSRLDADEIDALIADCSFHEAKASQIRAIAQRTETEFDGVLPADPDVLRSFRGVGPKCANLVAGIAGGRPLITVDIHVQRVTNRWGVVHAPTPEKTMTALEAVLPRRYWVEINALLVPFCKLDCTVSVDSCGARTA